MNQAQKVKRKNSKVENCDYLANEGPIGEKEKNDFLKRLDKLKADIHNKVPISEKSSDREVQQPAVVEKAKSIKTIVNPFQELRREMKLPEKSQKQPVELQPTKELVDISLVYKLQSALLSGESGDLESMSYSTKTELKRLANIIN